MGKGHFFWEQLLDQTAFAAESIPGQTIIEIAGEHRVLIENHHGVAAYDRNKIIAKVKYGCVCICGCNLEMVHMTREQLVICGKIEAITLQRRG